MPLVKNGQAEVHAARLLTAESNHGVHASRYPAVMGSNPCGPSLTCPHVLVVRGRRTHDALGRGLEDCAGPHGMRSTVLTGAGRDVELCAPSRADACAGLAPGPATGRLI